MASKGRKTGAGKPAAPKAAARPKAAPKPKVAAAAAEKPAPVVEPTPEPVPVAEAAPQEVETVSEAAEAAAVEAVEAEAEAVEAAETIEAEVAEVIEPAVAAEPVDVIEAIEAVVESAAEAILEPVVEAAAAFEAAAVSSKETYVMETIETNFAKAQAFFADFNDRAKAAVEKSTKLVEEANEFAKGNLEAVVESGKITAKGFESFGQDAAEYSRKSFETATAAMKSMASVKSPTEFFKLQSDFFRTSFDSAVAEASKNTEALIKLVGDASQPISNRVSLAAEKVKAAA